jgi:hypothetical protein
MIKDFTKRMNCVFDVSPLRSLLLCGKMVLYCVFWMNGDELIAHQAQGRWSPW